MKLTDFLQDVGRPIAYYPSLRRITGSTNATIFLCQLIYWKGKEADTEGWIYKTSEEMEAETGLSYDEQKTARAKLKEAGLIEEHYARLDHQMKYRLIFEAIDTAWGQPIPESRNPMLGKAESPNSLNRITENTTEKREIPQNMPIEWYIQHSLPIPSELTRNNAAEAQAVAEFESAFGFGQLPWDSVSEWQAFKKWVVKIYQSAPADFREYVEWRNGKGKYDAMNNKQIRLTPRAFMDTGYPTFKASAMYAKKTDEVRPEYKPYKPEERNYVPRPATIKPVIRKPAE